VKCPVEGASCFFQEKAGVNAEIPIGSEFYERSVLEEEKIAVVRFGLAGSVLQVVEADGLLFEERG
jgi:hypothetical protein